MDTHEVTITGFNQDGATLYEAKISAPNKTETRTYATLEGALDSFNPPLTARVRSHVTEGVRGKGEPVVFCLEDSLERQQ